MRLKSFYAKTMTEAMKMVRDTLGEDAIIVATREEQGGKAVRVTAAIDNDHHEPAPPARESARTSLKNASESWMIRQFEEEEDNENAIVEEITDLLLRHAVPEDVIDQIVSCVTVMGLEQTRVAFVGALENLFAFQPLPALGGRKAIMLVGPPGAGKTLTAAKIATRGIMNDQSVAVISTDTVRAGGVEQLSAFTRLLKVDLKKAKSAQSLHTILNDLPDADLTVIDTSGVNPFSPQEMKELAKLCAAGPIEPVLVLPAAMDADESGEIARAYATIGVRRLIPTRLDISRRLGGLLAAAHQGGLSFADASDTAQVANGLVQLSPKTLASFFLPETGARTKVTQKNAGTKAKIKAG